ncbi:hypothetical protein PoB_000268700 [Plakobranchus ocellatus]|uniref:Uncharacterized protein n=1 Tax=Plakobranchus ocellatus TaxID=259542 RepID=A0AAV3Y170_9GAST|nr:hypothetical protein PoB_000268700 [Plakobranchus ocellatus]
MDGQEFRTGHLMYLPRWLLESAVHAACIPHGMPGPVNAQVRCMGQDEDDGGFPAAALYPGGNPYINQIFRGRDNGNEIHQMIRFSRFD